MFHIPYKKYVKLTISYREIKEQILSNWWFYLSGSLIICLGMSVHGLILRLFDKETLLSVATGMKIIHLC